MTGLGAQIASAAALGALAGVAQLCAGAAGRLHPRLGARTRWRDITVTAAAFATTFTGFLLSMFAVLPVCLLVLGGGVGESGYRDSIALSIGAVLAYGGYSLICGRARRLQAYRVSGAMTLLAFVLSSLIVGVESVGHADVSWQRLGGLGGLAALASYAAARLARSE